MEAIVYVCPQCGASSPPALQRCLYCGVYFANSESVVKPMIIRIGHTVDFTKGIPSDLFRLLTQSLCEAEDIFESNSTLRSFFASEPLNVVKNWLRESNNITTRVLLLVDVLYKHSFYKPGAWYDGQNMLVVFLFQLYQYYMTKGAMPPKIQELYSLLKQKGILIEEVTYGFVPEGTT